MTQNARKWCDRQQKWYNKYDRLARLQPQSSKLYHLPLWEERWTPWSTLVWITPSMSLSVHYIGSTYLSLQNKCQLSVSMGTMMIDYVLWKYCLSLSRWVWCSFLRCAEPNCLVHRLQLTRDNLSTRNCGNHWVSSLQWKMASMGAGSQKWCLRGSRMRLRMRMKNMDENIYEYIHYTYERKTIVNK